MPAPNEVTEKAKHTPEPWNHLASDWRAFISTPDFTVADCGGSETAKANADRIVAYVNASAGMRDPAQEIAKLREDRKALLDSLNRIAFEPQGIPTATDAEVLRAVEHIARAAIDAARAEKEAA